LTGDMKGRVKEGKTFWGRVTNRKKRGIGKGKVEVRTREHVRRTKSGTAVESGNGK